MCKKIPVKIAKKPSKSTKCFPDFKSKDLLRYSISFFITGVIFLIIEIIFSPHNDAVLLEIISAVFMAFAILSFPYISREHKDNLGKYILNFGGYLLLVIFSAIFFLGFIENLHKGEVNVLFGVISAILLFLVLNFTIKPFISIISYVSIKIKQNSGNNAKNKAWTNLKNILKNIAIITSFIISILTIILNTLEIVLKSIEIMLK